MFLTTGRIKSVGELYGFVHKPAQSPLGWRGEDFYFPGSRSKYFLLRQNCKVFFHPALKKTGWRAKFVCPCWIFHFFLLSCVGLAGVVFWF